jgi:hypothetical protein
MKTVSREEERQQKSRDAEDFFEKDCKRRGILCYRIDDNNKIELHRKYLKNINGKRVDFLCERNNKYIFVETKTIAHFINPKIEKEVREAEERGISAVKDAMGVENPIKTHMKQARKQFKNIKDEYTYPRIVFLDGVIGIESLALYIFQGAGYHYVKENGELKCIGLKKSKKGLFDDTSSISAVVYCDSGGNYSGVGNNNSEIIFSKKDFNYFFSTKTKTEK